MIIKFGYNNPIYTKKLTTKNSKEHQSTHQSALTVNKSDLMPHTSALSFGWCIPHVDAMQFTNNLFNKSVLKQIEKQNIAKSTIEGLNKIKNTQYSLMDQASAEAAKLFSQYCNVQYSVSEMLPSYALSLNEPLILMMKELDTMNNPVNTLVVINDLTKLKTKAGIDKNTGLEYTKEQATKAKAGTQLYTTVMMLENINKNLHNSVLTDISREKINFLTNIIHSKIYEIYGKDAYQNIVNLSKMGSSPTFEQKKASLSLLKELDSKAQELSFPEEFEAGLRDLIDYQNKVEGKTLTNNGKGITDDLSLVLSYHTHPHINIKVQPDAVRNTSEGVKAKTPEKQIIKNQQEK